MISNQWGYNYGKTAVIYKGSPAWYLLNTYETLDSFLKTSDGTYNQSIATWAKWIFNRLGDTNGNVSSLVSKIDATSSYLTASDGTYNQSVSVWVRKLFDREGSNNNYLSVISANTESLSSLLKTSDGTYNQSVAVWLKWVFQELGVNGTLSGYVNNLYNLSKQQFTQFYDAFNALTLGPEGGRVSFYNIGNSIETIKNETRDLDNLLESIDGRVAALDALGVCLANIALTADEIKKGVNSSLQWHETLHGDLSMLRHGAADVLPGYADWTVWDFLQGIYFDIGQIADLLKGLQQTLTAWGNRWDSQDLYLMEWARRWDALDKSPADLSETNNLLGRLTADVASIRDKYVLEDALSSILDVLVGDLQTPQTQAALSSIQDVMSTRFPFCIPSLVNVVLFGSILADAAPPVWEFDIAGSPLVVDFSDYGQFAEVCRWTVLVLFTASLLLNTRRFIYGMGGGVE